MNLDRDSLVEPISDTRGCNVRANPCVVENKWRRTALARGVCIMRPMRPRSSKKICAELFLRDTKARRLRSGASRRDSASCKSVEKAIPKEINVGAPRSRANRIGSTCEEKRQVRLSTRRESNRHGYSRASVRRDERSFLDGLSMPILM